MIIFKKLWNFLIDLAEIYDETRKQTGYKGYL